MKISEAIQKVKDYHIGLVNGEPINEEVTRDKVLFGNVDQELTGIVTTCWATVDVIKKAIELEANLIICHEALFWNHGDHQEWLQEQNNETYKLKTDLLKKGNIVVWRNHDYIHSGIPMGDSYTDGIFYGVADKLDWVKYIVGDEKNPLSFRIPETTVGELAKYLIEKLNLNGLKVYGNLNNIVRKVTIPFHIFGDANEYITMANQGDVDCFLTMEIVDFTLAEYVKDSDMLRLNKSILAMGHFNLEEPGMEYMLKYLPEALGESVPCTFIQSGDTYNYIIK